MQYTVLQFIMDRVSLIYVTRSNACFDASSALAAALLAAALSTYAQEFRGSLSGRVIDQQQAVVPNAKILASGAETGARFQTVSNADGTYVLPFLPPGPYHLTAEAPGFKKYVNNNVRVTTNEREQIDIQLEVGSVDQSVTVSAEGSMLETATASDRPGNQYAADREHADQWPRAAGSGAVGFRRHPELRSRNSRGHSTTPAPRASPWAARPNQSNELLIDGSPDTTRNNRVAYNPPPDAVQEIKVETFQSDAAYGHTGGGTVNVVMRGGTNQLHGSALRVQSDQKLCRHALLHEQGGRQEVVV